MQNTAIFAAEKMAFSDDTCDSHILILNQNIHIVNSLLSQKIHFGHYSPMVQEAVKPINTDYISSVASDKKFQVRYICSYQHVQMTSQNPYFTTKLNG